MSYEPTAAAPSITRIDLTAVAREAQATSIETAAASGAIATRHSPRTAARRSPLRPRSRSRPAPARRPPPRCGRRLLEDPRSRISRPPTGAHPAGRAGAAAAAIGFFPALVAGARATLRRMRSCGGSSARWLEIDAWRGTCREGEPGQRPNTGGTRANRDRVARRDETQALLQRVPAAYRTQINDVLLTALALALRGWTGRDAHRIDMEGHGREEQIAPLDVSRTVGWFTTLYPVVLDLEGAPDDGSALEAHQGGPSPRAGSGPQLRRSPLRRARPRGRPAARRPALGGAAVQLSRPVRSGRGGLGAVSFRRRADRRLARTDERAHPPSRGGGRRARRPLRGSLDLRRRARPAGGRRATRRRFHRGVAPADRALHSSPESPGRTPSDFPLARLDQDAVDRLVARYPGDRGRLPALADAATVPLDGGAEAHGSASSNGSSVSRVALDAAALRAAWEATVARHAILRTAFVTDAVAEPLQVVNRRVALPWAQEDWTGRERGGPRRAGSGRSCARIGSAASTWAWRR